MKCFYSLLCALKPVKCTYRALENCLNNLNLFTCGHMTTQSIVSICEMEKAFNSPDLTQNDAAATTVNKFLC